MLLENYIKRAMQEYCSIFPTRFSVLDHLFAVNGNGIRLDEDGFMAERDDTLLADDLIIEAVNDHHSHAIDVTEKMINSLEEEHPDGEFSVAIEKMRRRVDVRKEKRAAQLERLRDIDSAYKEDPDFSDIHVYGWGSDKQFIPFYMMLDSKYDDLIEQLEYFSECIKKAEIPPEVDSDDLMANYQHDSIVGWKQVGVEHLDVEIYKLKQAKIKEKYHQ
ncbi:hypothetical protein VPHK567_0133 [Vibrio phage K567]|nr:hypothetical protein MYOV011v1_p0075 [Vibrio phage 6E35.1a]